MAYKSRESILENSSMFHITWQCHNQDWLLENEWPKKLYYELLLKHRKKYGLIFYGYQFMENHIHLAGKLTELETFSNYFRLINNLFARNLNHRLKRRGQVIMDRFLSLPIKDDRHMLAVLSYMDSNGVRAGRDKTPEESIWSSYRHYAYGDSDSLIDTAPTYFTLSNTPKERQVEYRQLVMVQLRGSRPYKNCSV